MKQLLTILLSIFTFSALAQNKNNANMFSPDRIIEGSKDNTLTYNPEGTVLANETDIRCVMYFFENQVWRATDVDLRQQEGKWVGKFDAPKEAALLVCKFYAGNLSDPKTVKTDWGWPATYTSFILNAKEQNKPGSNIAWGLLRSEHSPLTLPGLLEDSAAAPIKGDVTLFWFNNEFKYHPEEQARNIGYLATVLNRVKPGEKNEQLKENIRYFLADKNLKLTDQQWADIYEVCRRTLNDSALAAEVKAKEQKLYKHGIIERDEQIPVVSNKYTTDIPGGLKMFDEFMKTYPTEKFQNVHTFTTDLFYAKMFRSAIYSKIMKQNDYSNLQKYIHDIPYGELVTTHWHVVEVCFRNGQMTPEVLYPHSVLIINEMLGRPQLTDEQKLLSPREYEAAKAQRFSNALCAHARICTALGKYDEAMKYAEMVYPYYGAGNTEFATMWIKLLQENGRSSEVIPYIEQCVFSNQTSQDMLDLLRAEYLKKNPQGDFDKYLSSLQNKNEQDAEREKLIASLIDEPINLYELEKMGGGKVNLADKKGKIIFMDFWATWCAPCKASMPGGQMAVDRYKDDPDVEFYFIDTNETTAGFRQKVADFIKSKGYTFTVLFDEGEAGHQDKVYKDYCAQLHTSGIPFKIIVDGKGRLRWSKCGYNGSPSGMADEIQYVIDYLKNNP
ncbi:MAG: TlpA family protein disulfide reductase [Bacteroidaceae bacterium]|nr:TlpA family protein disulfide reductase [Bacteroidaceae bacterium]